MANFNEQHTGQLTVLTILIFFAVKELDEYIITQDRTWSAPEHLIGTTNVFDQIISGDYFNEKFDNHINQLDSLQREVTAFIQFLLDVFNVHLSQIITDQIFFIK